jgi:hypothetical protein
MLAKSGKDLDNDLKEKCEKCEEDLKKITVFNTEGHKHLELSQIYTEIKMIKDNENKGDEDEAIEG